MFASHTILHFLSLSIFFMQPTQFCLKPTGHHVPTLRPGTPDEDDGDPLRPRFFRNNLPVLASQHQRNVCWKPSTRPSCPHVRLRAVATVPFPLLLPEAHPSVLDLPSNLDSFTLDIPLLSNCPSPFELSRRHFNENATITRDLMEEIEAIAIGMNTCCGEKWLHYEVLTLHSIGISILFPLVCQECVQLHDPDCR